ncbi:MAG: polysaccharide biosynthesis C-terminal domain-containing protein [Bacteroidota bacterium]|nr:polysaccharide biosynthesis C-terminal domain-containing protein [Bacteroidota bacterium]
MSQKKFVTNLAILIILNLLVKPFWPLIIEPAVQAKVGNIAYGEYFSLFNFSFLLNILLDFGITNFNNKNIAQNNHLLSKHFSALFVLKISLAFLYIVVTFLVGFLIGFDFRLMKLLIVLCLNQFLISFIAYLRSNLLGLHLFKTDSLISILDRTIMIILCGLILWTNYTSVEIDIMNFVYVQTIAYAVTAVIAFIAVMRKTTHIKIVWNWPFSLMILKKSYPFAILVLLMTFYNRLDAVMIERLLGGDTGAFEAGIYAKGFRLLDSANMIAYLFSVQLLPVFSRMLKYKENVEQLVKLAFTLLLTPAFIVAIGCFFYNKELTALINHGNIDSAQVFSVLMCCFVAISTTYIFGTLLTANGNLKQLNYMALFGILVNIILNVILINYYKAMGSAISSLITQFLTAGIQIYLATKIFKFKTNKRLLIQLALFIGGIIVSNIFTYNLFHNWMINFSIMTIISAVWALVIGLISVKAIFRFLKY